MPDVPPPEQLQDLIEHYRDVLEHLPETVRRVLARKRPFEFRPVGAPSLLKSATAEPLRNTWFRAVSAVPNDEAMHRCLLAYVSDFNLLDTALVPHGILTTAQNLLMASVDHAMWFHRSVRVDEWLLYSTDSPSASGARGFTRGNIFSRDGRLVASTSQEGLLRVIDP